MGKQLSSPARGQKCQSSVWLRSLPVPGRAALPSWPARPAVLPTQPFLALPSASAGLPADFVPLAACTGSRPPGGPQTHTTDRINLRTWGAPVPRTEHPTPNAISEKSPALNKAQQGVSSSFPCTPNRSPLVLRPSSKTKLHSVQLVPTAPCLLHVCPCERRASVGFVL